jgi:single-stranded-DNA-specific exonuclease
MPKRWRIAAYDTERIAELGRQAGVSEIVAQLLLRRGIDDADSARRFLDCKLTGLREPEELPGATEAAARLATAVADRRRIVIYGDYDADGMTATAILYLCLQMIGGDVRYYVPSRLDEGYGLNHDALRKLSADGADVVVTVDCGIASPDEADTARELGLELIVTDHHEMGDRLPNAAALVHPRLPHAAGTTFPHLCGAGVALKIAWALCQKITGERRVGDRMRDFLMQAIGLAAIGTVADVVPLVDENRILVRHGLTSLKARPSLGLAELARVTRIAEKPNYDCEDIGFMLAPRLNAAGRLGQAQLAIELLTTASKERAAALAEYIHQLNESRQSLERSIYRAANKQATEKFDVENDPAFVLADHEWHPGVIGIVAGRLAEKYHRPVVLIGLDAVGVRPGAGSARSAAGLNLHEALTKCDDHLLSHGGHAAAAGLKIDPPQIDAFREAFCEHVAANLPDHGRPPDLEIDAEAPFTTLTHRTVAQIEGLAPFGAGNARPTLCTTGVVISGQVKQIGGGGRHLSLTLEHHGVSLRAVAFGGGEWADDLAGHKGPLSVAFRPVINTFGGRRSVEMHLADWRVDEAEGSGFGVQGSGPGA